MKLLLLLAFSLTGYGQTASPKPAPMTHCECQNKICMWAPDYPEGILGEVNSCDANDPLNKLLIEYLKSDVLPKPKKHKPPVNGFHGSPNAKVSYTTPGEIEPVNPIDDGVAHWPTSKQAPVP